MALITSSSGNLLFNEYQISHKTTGVVNPAHLACLIFINA